MEKYRSNLDTIKVINMIAHIRGDDVWLDLLSEKQKDKMIKAAHE